jgi:hypothetical protein
VIILFAFFAQIKSYATEQIPSYLIYNGKQYPLGNLLYPYLKKAKKEWRDTNDWCSALAGGYYAKFEIVGNELRLKDVRNCSKSLLKEFLSAFDVKDSIFKLDLFTDSIVIAEGKPLYGYVHEYYSILHFEKGKFIKETRMDYKEHLNIRLDKRAWLKISSSEDDYSGMFFGNISENDYETSLEIIEHYLETKKGDKSEFLTELKTKYKKKFGKPMSDFEFKIQRIKFKDGYELEITRTLYGARTKFIENQNSLVEVRLNIEEWLDFIRALSICCLDKWERVPRQIGRYSPSEVGGVFYIYSSSKGSAYDERYEFPIKSGQLSNLKKFEKVMENIIEKVDSTDDLILIQKSRSFDIVIP